MEGRGKARIDPSTQGVPHSPPPTKSRPASVRPSSYVCDRSESLTCCDSLRPDTPFAIHHTLIHGAD